MIATVADNAVDLEAVGELTLKGFQRPVTAFNVIGLKSAG